MKKIKSLHSCRGGGITSNILNFLNIPGVPIAYWVSKKFAELFVNNKLSDYADARIGMVTGDNERFLRLWYEIDNTKSFYEATDYISAFASGKKWFPLQKGGGKRYWYGNLEYVVNYEKDGFEIKFDNSINGRVRSHNYNGNKAFRNGITWNSIGTSDIITRISGKGFIYDAGGPLCTINDENNTNYFLGLLTSKVAQSIYKFINPTINYTPGTLLSLPIIIKIQKKPYINNLVCENINKSKKDWDSFETSWDFKKHPLI